MAKMSGAGVGVVCNVLESSAVVMGAAGSEWAKPLAVAIARRDALPLEVYADSLEEQGRDAGLVRKVAGRMRA